MIEGQPRHDPVARFVGWTACLFLGMWAYHLAWALAGHAHWPSDALFFGAGDRFMDFFNASSFSQALWRGESVYGHRMWNNYMPFANFLFLPFAVGPNPMRLGFYEATVLAGTFAVFVALLRQGPAASPTPRRHALMLMATSYPLVFLLDRGNFEGLQFLLVAGFVLLFQRGAALRAALVLAVACSLKPFAGVMALLFLWEGRWRAFACFLLAAGGLFAASLFALPGGLEPNWHGWLADLQRYEVRYVLGPQGLSYGHSLYAPLLASNLAWAWAEPQALKAGYAGAALVLLAALALAVPRLERPLWERVCWLSLAMVALPFVAGKYTMIHLYVPLLLFFGEEPARRREGGLFLGLFALAMAPKQFVPPVRVVGDYLLTPDALLLDPLLLMALAAWLLWRATTAKVVGRAPGRV